MPEGGWSSGAWGEAGWGMSVYYRDSSETSIITDSDIASGNVFLPSVSESAAITDANNGAHVLQSSVSETSSGADVVSTRAVFNSVTVSEIVRMLDSPNAAQTFNTLINELLSVSDLINGNVIFQSQVNEIINVTDTSSSLPAFYVTFTDTATGVDSPSSASQKGARTFVSASISDEVTDLGSEVNVAVFENGAVSEISAIPASIFSGAVIESVVVTDSIRAKFFWDPVDDDQTAAWGNINNNQTASWTLITSTQNPNWTDINNA